MMFMILVSLMRAAASHCRMLGYRLAGESGQDIIEYALLAAFIGIAGWAAVMAIPAMVGDTYSSWLDPTVGVPSLWQPAEPLTSGGGS